MSNSSYGSDSEEKGEEFRGKILIGQKGKYLLIDKIGHGAFSSVWLCFNTSDKKYYAIKIQNPEDYFDGKDELRILKKCLLLKDNNIIKLLDDFIISKKNIKKVKEKKGSSYIYKNKIVYKKYICMVLPLMGYNIYNLLKMNKSGLDNKLIKNIIISIVESLIELLKSYQICHTDLKPENILININNSKYQKLIDKYNNYNILDICEKQINGITNNNKKKKAKAKILKKLHIKILSKMDLLYENNSYTNSNSNSNSEYSYKYSISDSDSEVNNIDINDIKKNDIKLSDFGTAIKTKYLDNDIIQTRYYRAPEVILRNKYNESIDVWSIGCILYELYTGKVLFNPEKDSETTTDQQHLHLISKYFGKIPKRMLKKNIYPKVRQIDFSEIFPKDKQNQDLIDLIKKCCVINPNDRIKLSEILNHNFLV